VAGWVLFVFVVEEVAVFSVVEVGVGVEVDVEVDVEVVVSVEVVSVEVVVSVVGSAGLGTKRCLREVSSFFLMSSWMVRLPYQATNPILDYEFN
jgi:hypothetical protein